MKKTGIDNQYLNISINPTSTTGNSLALYDESFSRGVLSNPEDYYCSVARFSCPLSEIPILKFKVDPLQNDNLTSSLVIGIKTAGLVYFPQFVKFIAQNNIALPVAGGAAPFFTTTQLTSKCYDIFSVTAFLTMINTALAAAVTASAIGVAAPFYTWSPTSELFSLNVSAAFIATGASIYMNESLNNYLAGFQYFQRYNTTVSEDYTHVMPSGAGPFVISADYRTIALWFDIRKLILVTASLPVHQETSPTQNAATGLTEGVIGFTPILTDFLISFDSISQYATFANYNPDTYRLIDMIANTPINQLNLQFYWVTKTGDQFPVEISNSQTATLKLAFSKVSLYNNEY